MSGGATIRSRSHHTPAASGVMSTLNRRSRLFGSHSAISLKERVILTMPLNRSGQVRRQILKFRRIRSTYLVASAAMVALDLVAKSQIEQLLVDVGASTPMMPGLNLTLGHNRGISFGLLDSEHRIAPFFLSSVAVVLVVAVLIWTAQQKSKLLNAAGILFASGGLANAIDRLGDGAVTDYVDIGWQAWRWPTFNLADVLIFVGVVLLLLGWRKGRNLTGDA